MTEDVTFPTSDGESLQGELFVPDGPARAAIVITHPHPQMGGDMYTPVPAGMFRALADVGVAGMRFNFRGVGRSTGSHDNGVAEQLDIVAALDHLADRVPDVPLLAAGWSFGADMILTVADDRLQGRFLAAAPLRIVDASTMAARTSTDPKVFAVPENDQFAPPSAVEPVLADWTNAEVELIAGADHFFGPQLPALLEQFTQFIEHRAQAR